MLDRRWFKYPGALIFGFGIGGGIINGHITFGTVCFILAGILWIAGEFFGKQEQE